jgi:hypothetical protein
MVTNKLPGIVKGFDEFNGGTPKDDQGPYFFKYCNNQDELNATIDKMRKRDTDKLLCVPIT